MKISERILEGIKTALVKGEAVVKLAESTQDINEASAITGSGSGIGGRTYFDNAFAAARYANPFRQGSRQILIGGSDVQFVAKTGNAADASDPWGYDVNPNSGSPNINTTIWQLPVRVLSASLPVRTAVLSDVNGLDMELVEDLGMEFSQLEAASMALNNDQSGSTTTVTGAESGLRGLFTYPTSTSAAAYGTSGVSITSGLHTILAVNQAASAIAYDDVVNLTAKLPPQYWAMETTAFHAHPTTIQALRKLKSTGGGVPMFIEAGEDDSAAVGYVFGFPVIPNPYMSEIGAGNVTLVLANWARFLTIADIEEMSIKTYEQAQAGFITLYAEKRVASSVRDPFAGVYLKGV